MEGSHHAGGANNPGSDGQRASVEAPIGGSCSGGGMAGEECCHLRDGNGGCWPTNVGPARRLGGTCQKGISNLLGGWAKPTIRG